MSETFKELNSYLEKAQAFKTAMNLFEWDNETCAPSQASAYTAKMIGVISGEYFNVITDAKVKELVEACKADESITEIEAAIVREVAGEIERLDSIPAEEYREFAEICAAGGNIWANARKNKDFASFAPTLKKVIEYQKKFASYRAKEGQKIYDVMLDEYEKGFDMEALDQFFLTLREQLVPFLKKIMDSGVEIDNTFLFGDYANEKQEEMGRFFAKYVGFDFERGIMGVSAHPFTMELHNHDVRITTFFGEEVSDSIFSVIHESGHAIYEQGIPDEMTQTLVGTGASMGMHESQSRFFENIIGRNEGFWVPVYSKLQETFPEQLGHISREQFVKAINRVKPGLIRTHSDELCYSLHIMVRYEIEKMLIEGDLSVDQLPEIWADKYEEYLGIRPDNVAVGVLQDIHWSQGAFGYFPSYALGSAFGAQLYMHMRKQMDFEGLLRSGDISVIREYLRTNIHQYGKLKDSRQILMDVTGEDFNPQYYVDYLIEKYSKVYGI